MRYALSLVVLMGCSGQGETELPDCATAVCERVRLYPDAGGIEAGQGLPHLACRSTVAGCFEQACRPDPEARAMCPVEIP